MEQPCALIQPPKLFRTPRNNHIYANLDLIWIFHVFERDKNKAGVRGRDKRLAGAVVTDLGEVSVIHPL